jgi:predicted transcriptional regulator
MEDITEDEKDILDTIIRYMVKYAGIDSNSTKDCKALGLEQNELTELIVKISKMGFIANKTPNIGGNQFRLTEKGEEFYKNGGFEGLRRKETETKREKAQAYELRELNISVSKSTLELHRFQRRSGNISIFISTLAFLVAAGALMVKIYELNITKHQQLKEPTPTPTQGQLYPSIHKVNRDSSTDSSQFKINKLK